MERDVFPSTLNSARDISTHTLTWSVTTIYSGIVACYMYFNSHAHVERDRTYLWYTIDTVISTHTLTWSVTLDVVYIWCLLNVMRTYYFYLMGIGLILFTVHSQIAWHFHANLLGICESLGVRWSKY